MPDVNDDMDELFRKAAENYPLNTGSSDWNEVHKALAPLPAKLNDTGSQNRYLHFLWLLLLLPFIFFTNKYFSNPSHQKPAKETLSATNNGNFNQQKVSKKGDLRKNVESIQSFSPANAAGAATVILTKIILSKTSIIKGAPKDKTNISAVKDFTHSSSGTTVENIDTMHSKSLSNSQFSLYGDVTEAEMTQVAKIISEPYITKAISVNAEYYDKLKPTLYSSITTTDSLSPRDNIKAEKPKSKAQHFYAGVLTGPDVTAVKFQKIMKTGITAAVMAGYNLNNKWSIETGLYVDKKYYYTKGKYLKPKNANIPWYTKIEDLDGDCLMLEIPVNIKYDFKVNNKLTWFALIGSSSYIMKTEDYDYTYQHNGQLVKKNLSYKNSSTTWASVINLSLGYSRSVGKGAMLRIEPYIKMPLKGIGTGSLPITSSGMYIGITKKIF